MATGPDTRKAAVADPDRTCLASSTLRGEIVRYDRSGKYRQETFDGSGLLGSSHALTLKQAVDPALLYVADGGAIHTGKPGGMRFYAAVKKAREAKTR